MRIVAVLAIGCLLGSCAFAVRHPAITAGIAGALVAGGTCELSTHNASDGGGGEEAACAITTGAVGVGLGLIVAAAIYLGGDGHTILVQDNPPPEPPMHTFKQAEPAAPVDAGVAPLD